MGYQAAEKLGVYTKRRWSLPYGANVKIVSGCSNWFVLFIWFIWSIWFNQTNETNQIDQTTIFLCWRTFSASC